MSEHESENESAPESAPEQPSVPMPASTPASAAAPAMPDLSPAVWTQLLAGLVAFIASMLPFYTVSVDAMGFSTSASASAWHGFFGWAAALLALAGSAVLAIELFAPQVKLPVPAALASVGAFGLATVFAVLAWFVWPGGSVTIPGMEDVFDFGRGFGFYLLLVAVVAGLVTAVLRFLKKTA
jgi:hypothetical protein